MFLFQRSNGAGLEEALALILLFYFPAHITYIHVYRKIILFIGRGNPSMLGEREFSIACSS